MLEAGRSIGHARAGSGRLAGAARRRPPPGVEHLILFLGEGCFFGLVPVGGGRTYGFAGTATAGRRGAGARATDPFRDDSPAFGRSRFDYLSLLDGTAPRAAPIEDLELDGSAPRKVLLVSDAAHAMPPHAGRAAASHRRGALVLAEELDRAGTLPAAFARFTVRRRPRVEWVRRQTRAAAAAWMLPRSSATLCCASAATGSCRSATSPCARCP